MSLKKKIATSFLISAGIIAVLVGFEYVGFVKIRAEIRHLEFTDTIRSQSLQLRRHEKNYFLFGPHQATEEAKLVQAYLGEIQMLIADYWDGHEREDLRALKRSVDEYRGTFARIEDLAEDLLAELRRTEDSRAGQFRFFPIVEAAFLDKPTQTAEFLKNTLDLTDQAPLVKGLRTMGAEILALRKEGESIINSARELDKGARVMVESVINQSQTAILIFFPLFFFVGIGALFMITGNVIQRIESLSQIMDRAGRGDFVPIPIDADDNASADEVAALFRRFNDMQFQLGQRNQELKLKNEELLENRKLAVIGTLASGVAHELNNPLNNMAISANILVKELQVDDRALVRETVTDIVGQTVRVKGIIQDLLEFARGRPPQLQTADLIEIIRKAWESVSRSAEVETVEIMIRTSEPRVDMDLDPQRMERVFAVRKAWAKAMRQNWQEGWRLISISPLRIIRFLMPLTALVQRFSLFTMRRMKKRHSGRSPI